MATASSAGNYLCMLRCGGVCVCDNGAVRGRTFSKPDTPAPHHVPGNASCGRDGPPGGGGTTFLRVGTQHKTTDPWFCATIPLP